jgi:hypothetical protein
MHDTASHGHPPAPEGYDPPRLITLGKVSELTQASHGHGKSYGGSDGFSFMGFPVTNTSP